MVRGRVAQRMKLCCCLSSKSGKPPFPLKKDDHSLYVSNFVAANNRAGAACEPIGKDRTSVAINEIAVELAGLRNGT